MTEPRALPEATAGPVVTLTAAGAIDATYRLPVPLERGAFVRASGWEREVSGKGVNVSAALRAAGVATAAVVVLGADDVAFAAQSPLADVLRIVTVPGATRVNTSIIDAGGATTKVNAPTPPLTPAAWDETRSAVVGACRALAASWLVVSGTLPEVTGAEARIADVVRAVRGAGVRVAVDTSGAALAELVADPAEVALLKPNTHELAELVGRPLRTIGEVTAAARELVARGVATVYTSMGADGVLVVADAAVIHARAVAPAVVNTAGAGDASLAGFLHGLGGASGGRAALTTAAATAASWGALAVSRPTTLLDAVEAAPRAVVTDEPDPATRLTEPAV